MIKLDIPNPFNAPVYHEEIVSSTMDTLKLLAGEGAPHGTVIIADYQENGRGRGNNRSWEMEKGVNLPFSILLRYESVEVIPAALTLRTGLIVSLAIEDFVPSLQDKVKVKWPNDIIINSKKTAGILCEADDGNVFLGVGINVAQKKFPEHLRQKATSIALEINDVQMIESKEKYTLLEKILLRLYNELENPSNKNWIINLKQRLFMLNEKIIFIDGAVDSGKEIKGQLIGIGDNGELLILPEGDSEIKSFVTGEVKF